MMQKSIYSFLLLIFSFSLFGQESVYLSLGDIIATTKSGNLSIKKSQARVGLAKAEFKKSKEWWLPNIFLGTNIHHLDGSALNSDGKIFPDVNRQTRWYGGEINLDLDIGKGIYASKAKKLQLEQAVFQNEVASNSILLNTILSYYQLLKISAEKKVYEELIINKENLIGQLEGQVSSGLKLKSELLLAKSNASRYKVQVIELNQKYQIAISNLALAMDISDRSKIYIDLEDLKKVDLINPSEVSTLDQENHPSYKMLEAQMTSENIVTKGITRSLLIPQVGIRYSYGPFGFDYSNNQLTRGLQGYLGWNIPLGQLIYGGDSKISKSKSILYQLDLEIKKETLSQKVVEYTNQLSDAIEMIALTEEGITYSKESLDQSNQRLAAGLGNLYEVLLAEEEYKQTQIQYLDAIIGYNMIQYRLWDALGREI